MPDQLHTTLDGHSYELIIGENEACAIEHSTDGSYQTRWFVSITDAMRWWTELTDFDGY